MSPALEVDSLPLGHQGSPKNISNQYFGPKVKVAQSCLTLYSPWNSPGQSTGVGSLSLLQGISPTQGWSPGLLCCSWILNQLSHQGSPIYNIFTHFLSPKSSFFFSSDFKIQTFALVPKSIKTLAPGTTVTGPNGYVSLCRTCLVTFLGGLGWSGDTVYHAMGTAVKQPWMVHFWIKVWSHLSFWSLVSFWSR